MDEVTHANQMPFRLSWKSRGTDYLKSIVSNLHSSIDYQYKKMWEMPLLHLDHCSRIGEPRQSRCVSIMPEMHACSVLLGTVAVISLTVPPYSQKSKHKILVAPGADRSALNWKMGLCHTMTPDLGFMRDRDRSSTFNFIKFWKSSFTCRQRLQYQTKVEQRREKKRGNIHT